MGTDALLAVLKFVGAATAGVLGAAGLLFDFKNSAGRLNRTGYYVLAGIIVAALVGMGSSLLEAYKAKAEAKQQMARTEQLLREIDRAVQPITMLKTTYWLEIVPKDEVVMSYIDQIRKTIENNIHDLRKMNRTQDGLQASAMDIHGDPLTITIDQKSALWPHDDASYIGDAARQFAFGIFMMRKPVRPPISIVVGHADFSASTFPLFDPQDNVSLDWDRQKSKLYIFSSQEYDRRFWHINGKISSPIDLLGSQLQLTYPYLPNIVGITYTPEQIKIFEFERSLELQTIAIQLSVGQEVWLKGADMKNIALGGQRLLVVTLPSDQQEFDNFVRSRDD